MRMQENDDEMGGSSHEWMEVPETGKGASSVITSVHSPNRPRCMDNARISSSQLPPLLAGTRYVASAQNPYPSTHGPRHGFKVLTTHWKPEYHRWRVQARGDVNGDGSAGMGGSCLCTHARGAHYKWRDDR